ncbi:choice-of-anchor J domain-containing protein, partial [Aequorivita flava]
MKKITMLVFVLFGIITTMEAQFIQQNATVYGSRIPVVENMQQPTTVLQNLVQSATYDPQSGYYFEQRVLNNQSVGQRGPQAILLDEGFDDITTLPGAGFSFVNASDAVGLTDWFQGNETVFPAQSGAPTAYIGANFNNTAGSVINNFMITPMLNLENGDEIIFWTRVPTGSGFPDRLEVRIDPTGANTDPTGPADVGSYTELLLEINPTLTTGGYPEVWTQFTVPITGLTGATDTRVAFRYWVTDAGPAGSNSDYIGIDTLTIEEGAGGGGGVCGTPILEVNQDIDDACMANISQGGLAQSYIALEAQSAGAGIKFRDPSTGLDVDLSLWDGLPNAGGTMLASGTTQTDGTNWADVYWDPVVDLTVGNTYYIVIEGDITLPCVAGSLVDPYPDGNVFANPNYDPFPAYDYTFRTYSCDSGGGGNNWTVTVEDTVNFGDEVSWELRDNLGAVILSGGPYGAPPYSDTQMVTTSNEPLEFYIEAIGTFGDNTPTYTVSCSGNVIITGTVVGGTDNTFPGLVCGGGGGCPIVSDCNLIDATPDDATSPNIWDRPFADGTCCSGLGPVSYDVYGPFTVDVTGLYTVDSDQDGGAWDGYIFLYETCFDPLDQTTNFVAGDDDGPGGLGTSQILDVTLTAGTEYYLITTGFSAGDFGDFENTITGVGTVSCGGPVLTYDDCAGAIALSCGDSVVGETLTATDSGGNSAPDVFYKFT